MKTRLLWFPVVVTMLLLAGCSSSNKPAASDSAIKDAIQAKLFQDATLKARDIHVDSQKGVVTLTGAVGSDMEKLAVEGLARGTAGVDQVNNQLTVSSDVAAQTPAPEQRAANEEPAAPKSERTHKSRESHHARRSSEAVTSAAAAPAAPEDASQAAAPAASQVAEAAPAPAPQPPPPPPPQPVQVTVPAGTVITVRMINGIDSATGRAGEEYQASLEVPVVVGERVLIQRGADARVRLAQDTSAGRVQGRSSVKLELVSISANGTTYNVETGYFEKQGASQGKRTAGTIGGAAGLGALIGAIAGGGKGAAIGAGVGAGAGGVATAAMKGQQVKIPPETKLDFTLKTPFTVTVNP